MKATSNMVLFLAMLLLCCSCVLLLTHVATAQTVTSGDIIGTITDPQGAVVPNASLTAKITETGASMTTKSTAQGTFRFSSLPPGRYDVTANASGFSPTTRPAVVSIGGTTNLPLQLGVGASSTTVEVTAETPVISLSPSDTTTTSTIQIEQMPNGGQDLTQIAQIAPGAKMNTQGGYGNF